MPLKIKKILFICTLSLFSVTTFAAEHQIKWTSIYVQNQSNHFITATLGCEAGSQHYLTPLSIGNSEEINKIYCDENDNDYVTVYDGYTDIRPETLRCQTVNFPARNGNDVHIIVHNDDSCEIQK